MTLALAMTTTATLFAGTSNHLGFATYAVTLSTGRTVFVAVTKDTDRTCNPMGIYQVTIGGKLSSSDAWDAAASVAREHGAWFRRVCGADAMPLYSPAECWTRADFRHFYEV